jgi:hypothetical protein
MARSSARSRPPVDARDRLVITTGVDQLPPGRRHTIWDEAETRDFVVTCLAGRLGVHWDGNTAELSRPGWSRVVRGRRVDLEALGGPASASFAVL